jgi:pimeloyl-ACP methyl ester carboxylesterase
MAEPLVLLSGMMCDARLFAPQIASLSAGRTLVLPTLVGGDTMAALAAGIIAEAPPRFALAGFSMGGIVAMEVVRQASARVSRLALLDTNPLAETEEMKALREPQIAAARAGALERVVRETRGRNAGAAPLPDAVADLVLRMALALGPDVFERQSRALQTRPDQTATLRAFDRPALVLCGGEDRACPVDRHTLMAALMPQARLVVVPRAGHLTPLETPEAVCAALADWLAA